jgi:CheY-like chemotaxis protein
MCKPWQHSSIAARPGQDVWRQLRADPRTAHIPLIVVSASADAAQAVREIGADGCLEKHFDLDTLLRTVAAYTRAAAQ